MSGYDLAQTFFIDPDAAQQAPSVHITSIIYFLTANLFKVRQRPVLSRQV